MSSIHIPSDSDFTKDQWEKFAEYCEILRPLTNRQLRLEIKVNPFISHELKGGYKNKWALLGILADYYLKCEGMKPRTMCDGAGLAEILRRNCSTKNTYTANLKLF